MRIRNTIRILLAQGETPKLIPRSNQLFNSTTTGIYLIDINQKQAIPPSILGAPERPVRPPNPKNS